MKIDAKCLDFRELNAAVRSVAEDIEIDNCLGQRFIGSGLADKKITVNGIPGNALGAYLDGAYIEVFGNAQDAVGDTMNTGRITVHGNVGDAVGYAMRGGEIFIRGNAGYRAGIHMKAYMDKKPAIIIGGHAGSFLGEYQAGGLIIVLALDGGLPFGNFPCTGMHGGVMLLRGSHTDIQLPPGVHADPADSAVMTEAEKHIRAFCEAFGLDSAEVLDSPYTAITPDTKNPYKQMYVRN